MLPILGQIAPVIHSHDQIGTLIRSQCRTSWLLQSRGLWPGFLRHHSRTKARKLIPFKSREIEGAYRPLQLGSGWKDGGSRALQNAKSVVYDDPDYSAKEESGKVECVRASLLKPPGGWETTSCIKNNKDKHVDKAGVSQHSEWPSYRRSQWIE